MELNVVLIVLIILAILYIVKTAYEGLSDNEG